MQRGDWPGNRVGRSEVSHACAFFGGMAGRRPRRESSPDQANTASPCWSDAAIWRTTIAW
jgi:hypothetical protein